MCVRLQLFVAFTLFCFGWLASSSQSLANDSALDLPPRGQQDNAEARSRFTSTDQEEAAAAASGADSADQPLLVERLRDGENQLSGDSLRGPGRTARPAQKAGAGSPAGESLEEEEAEEEEEVLLSTDDLELLRQIRLARDQQASHGGWGLEKIADLHSSMQLVMWLALAVVVYFVVSGATRGDEKKKSLESHKAVLKATADELVEGKKLKHQLQQEREGITSERSRLLNEAEALTAQLEAVMRDIQQTAALSEEEGEGRPEGGPEAKTTKETAAAGDEGGAALALSLTVPGIDKGSREANFELQDMLLHQGDLPYQEEAIRRGLGVELKEKDDALSGAKQQEGEAEAASKTPDQSRRGRQLGLLSLSTVMLRRQAGLDFAVKQLQEELDRSSSDCVSPLSQVLSEAAVMRKMLMDFRVELDSAVEEVRAAFAGKGPGAARIKEAADRVAESLRSAVDSWLADNVLLPEAGSRSGILGTMRAAAAARRHLLQLLHSNTKLVLKQLSGFQKGADSAVEKASVKALGRLLNVAQSRVTALAAAFGFLRDKTLLAFVEGRDQRILFAELKEKQRAFRAQLKLTKQWISQAMQLYRRL
ncbi:hypothetical protein Efla_007100 [Eimeria flavescens]